MKRILAILLMAALLLGLVGCAHDAGEIQPGSRLEGSGAENSAVSSGLESSKQESSVSEQATAAPVSKPEDLDSTYPIKEPTYHDWDGSDTLFPYATIAYPGNQPFIFEQGALLTTNSELYYLDFVSGQMVPFCFLPNCRHHTAVCNAQLLNRDSTFVANNKFYFLDGKNVRSVYDEELEVYVGEIDLYVSSLNGSNEKKITSIRTDIHLDEYNQLAFTSLISNIVLYGDSAFLFYDLRRKSYSDGNDSPEDSYGHSYVTEIDLKQDKVVRTQVLATGYWPNANPLCAYGGGIYLRVSWSDEPIVLLPVEDEEINGDIEIAQTYARYDIVTGEMETREDAYPDEYFGPLAPFDGEVRPMGPYDSMVEDWCLANDGDIKAYNMATGEVRVLYENVSIEPFFGRPWAIRAGGGNVIVIGMNDKEETTVLYDYDTDESHVLGHAWLEGVGEIWMPNVIGQKGNFIFGRVQDFSGDLGTIGYGAFDVSDGYDKPKFILMQAI